MKSIDNFNYINYEKAFQYESTLLHSVYIFKFANQTTGILSNYASVSSVSLTDLSLSSSSAASLSSRLLISALYSALVISPS